MSSNVVSTTLGSATQTSSVLGKEVDVQIYDSSSFSGTFQIQRKLGGSWYVCSDNLSGTTCEGTAADLPYARVIKNGKAREIRVAVTSYTSGTLGVEIG